MGTAIDSLRKHLGVIRDIECAASVLGWDQQTMMPPADSTSVANGVGHGS